MTTPRNAVVVTTESSPEKPAVSYALRTRTAEMLNKDVVRAQIMPLVPHGVDWERVLLEVHRAAIDNQEILECTESSIVKAIGTAVQTGLTIGKTIHLVPVNTKVSKDPEPKRYEKRLQAWTDYKGDIELVIWSGAARHVDAHAVYQNDVFEYELGDKPYVKHRPVLDAAKRGPLIAAYCIAHLNGLGTLRKIVVCPLADIEKVRKGSKQWSTEKVKDCPPWYAIKTAVHLNCKTLPKSQRLLTVLSMMEARDAHERGDEFVDVLDESRRIEVPAAAAIASAPPAPTEFEDAPPAPSKAALFPLPFGRDSKGTAIGALDAETLVKAYDWAKEQTDPEKQFPEFIAAAEELFEERRLAADGAA